MTRVGRRRPQHIRRSRGQQAGWAQSETPRASRWAGTRRLALAALVSLLAGAEARAQTGPLAPEAAITAGEVQEIVAVLAHDSLEGREAGTPGAESAARFIAGRFAAVGLSAPEGGFLQLFELPPAVRIGPGNRLSFTTHERGEKGGALQLGSEFTPAEFSATGAASGPLRLEDGSRDSEDAPEAGLAGAVLMLAPASHEDAAGLRGRIARLEEAGAAAVLILSDPSARAIPGRPLGAPASIPVVKLGFPAAERLAEAAGIDLVAFVHGAAAEVRAPIEVSLAVDLSREQGTSANVIGILAGKDPALAGQAIVIGAHYDHLGRGGPGSLAPGSAAIHNGADDNASGVAGVLELAERFAADPPRRTLVFAAFGAEELGNIGSSHYVTSPAWPLEGTLAMLNLDMIGRLREKLTVYGTGTSPAWPQILDDLEAAREKGEEQPPAQGPQLARVPDGFGPSDHASFYAARIPVLALFTGAHEDYHRPTDDPEKIDAAGEVRVLELAAEVIERIADSDQPVPYAEAPVTERRAMAFRVALGTLPDYAFAGPGVRLASVRPAGPAARAGLEAGDVILRLAGREVADVYGYTAILAELEAGSAVELVYVRGEEKRTTTVMPEAR